MSDETTPGPDLREQIAEAVMAWHGARITMCEHTQMVSFGEAAIAVLAVVQPELGRRDAEIEELKAAVARVKALAEELIATGDVSIGGIWSDHNIEIGRDLLAVLDQPREST